MHGVIRRYRVRLGTMEQAVRYVERWFVPLTEEIPGFGAAYLMVEEPQTLTLIGLFETTDGAKTAGRLAAEWFGKEWGSFRALPPEVIGGEIKAQTLARSASERRQVSDRRATFGDALGTEDRAGERRSGGERRARGERQAAQVELRAAG